MKNLLALACFAVSAVACTGLPLDGEVDDAEVQFNDEQGLGTSSQAIQDGRAVTNDNSRWRYVVQVAGCTGTVIGPRHVLTAAHCYSVGKGDEIGYYVASSSGSGSPKASGSKVAWMYRANGVTSEDYKDTSGDFADYLVLYLDKDLPSTTRAAILADGYAGPDTPVYQLGRGNHDDDSNNANVLRYTTDEIYNHDNDEGHFSTKDHGTNPGDSGGPVLTYYEASSQYKVHGALYGSWFRWFKMRSKYTSVSFHFDDIMEAVGHVRRNNFEYVGGTIATYPNQFKDSCAALCMANASCKAYTHTEIVPVFGLGTCELKASTANGSAATKATTSGFKKVTGTCNPTPPTGVCGL